MNIKELYKEYKESDYYNYAYAVIEANDVIYKSEYAENIIYMEQLQEGIISVLEGMIEFIGIEKNINDDDIYKYQHNICDTIDFYHYSDIFNHTEHGKTFINDVLHSLFEKVELYIDFTFIYKINEHIKNIILTEGVPPIKDYKTVCLELETPINIEELHDIKNKLGATETITENGYNLMIKGFYHYKQSWEEIADMIKEDC